MMSPRGSAFPEDEDVSKMLEERLNDTIVTLAVVEGEPHIGSTTGKKHPIYDVQLLGMNDSTRTRSYRFDAFRSFHENSVIAGGVKLSSPFPPTFFKSSMGMQLSKQQIRDRCSGLDKYLQELYKKKEQWSPKLTMATLKFLKVDETQVFPKGGSIAEGAGRSPAPSMIDSPLRRFSTRAGAQAQLVRRAARVLEMNSKNISKNNKKVTNLAALALAGRGAHLPGEAWVNSLDDETFARLERCVASGLENADSSIGCYAMSPTDYSSGEIGSSLWPFFASVVGGYHGGGPHALHETNWTLPAGTGALAGLPADGVLDLRRLGVAEPLSMRVRVGRNLTSFPLPGAMTKEDRVKFEKTMLGAFAELIANESYGGAVYSMTPHADWTEVTGEAGGNPNLISAEKYQELVDAHVMFKDMAADPYLASAGIASDWPCGRGCYQSKDGGFIIWFGEEDQLRIMCMGTGFVLNSVFGRLEGALKMVESIDGIEFATSTKYGYVTSCPSNLGTGMRASVHLKVPNLINAADGTDAHARDICKPLGLSVRGLGGEHTPVGADGTVDVSPSARLFVTEGQIVARLFQGVKLLLAEEKKAAPVINRAFLFLKPHANTPAVASLVRNHLSVCGISVVGEGSLTAQEIDARQVIDQHYYAIASKATILKPSELNVPPEKFEAQFGLTWEAALAAGNVYNAMDACAVLGITGDEMDAQWGACKKAKKLVKLGGGFYCGLVEVSGKPPVYVFNGFFMSMRAKYTAPGAAVSWLCIEWPAAEISWEQFRAEFLGPTDPSEAPVTSLRGQLYTKWADVGLAKQPDVGDNGVHASASPFEALAERMNWCGATFNDPFCCDLLEAGLPLNVITAWAKDPQVFLGDGTSGSLFDALEDLDANECLDRCVGLNQARQALEGTVLVRVSAGASATSSSASTQSFTFTGPCAVFPDVAAAEARAANGGKDVLRSSFRPTRRGGVGVSGLDSSSSSSSSAEGSASTKRVLRVVRSKDGSHDTVNAAALASAEANAARRRETRARLEAKAAAEAEAAKAEAASSGEADAAAAAAEHDYDERRSVGGAAGTASEVSEEFKRELENGFKLVKFNRRGQAAFRTLYASQWDSGKLSWKATKKEGLGKAAYKMISAKPETVDLSKLRDVRAGESTDPEAAGGGKWGTPTLRMYVARNAHGIRMLRGGITFCLVFGDRTLDFCADSMAQRDYIVAGFKSLKLYLDAERG